MAHYQISLDSEILQGLLSRGDGLSALVQEVLNQVLQAQLADQLKAAPYEQTPERSGYRNGTRSRGLLTRVGPLSLDVPRVRSGSFSTDLFERYQRSEQALLAAMVQMVLEGVSTRKVDAIVEELCGGSVSKSTVSALCERLDPLVKEWNERDLSSKEYPFLLVDALVIRVRLNGRVRQQSVLLATGINEEGHKGLLGLMIGDSESEVSWSEYFAQLKARGLRGVDLVVSDQHAGLVKAIRLHFQGATWQRCQTHLSKNVLNLCPKEHHSRLKSLLRELFVASEPASAKSKLVQIREQFEQTAPKAVALLEEAFDDATAVLQLPQTYRQRLRTTNVQERLNEEIRRRERVIRIFPSGPSAKRLIGALLMEWDELWSTNRHPYLDMDAYWEWRQELDQIAA